ncbi:MAG: glycosyltransferase family 9 protein [Kangiellaceae bacterium]|nr:glycosyltransferase family 9 protein [Kangiellaceae bacterium]
MLSKISDPRKICILRFSSIGDVCHAVAAVQAIQKKWPKAQITWIIGKTEFRLLKGLAGVEFVVFDKSMGFKAITKLKKELKGHHFDILLHMQVSLRASMASLCISATEKWGFDKKRAREAQWLFTNRRISPQDSPHVADGFLSFASAIGADVGSGPVWQMPIAQVELSWFARIQELKTRYVVISPAASQAERNWKADRYAALCDYIESKGFQVVLCGSNSKIENSLTQEVLKQCQSEPVNLVGKTTLRQLLVVLKNAQMVIAPDTGPSHMAVTVGTPVIGLYMHSNPQRTGPYNFRDYVVSHYEETLKTITGKSIQDNPWGKRIKGEHLMEYISLAEVQSMFDRVVNELKLDEFENTFGEQKYSCDVIKLESVG